MAESENLSRLINPCILHLQKMELELKCPLCLCLLRQPMLLPCNHIFCRSCISSSMGCELHCPVCKFSYLHQDMRAAPHMESMVLIYKSISAAFEANLLQSGARVYNFESTKSPSSENPLSGNIDVEEKSDEELVQEAARPENRNDETANNLVQVSIHATEYEVHKTKRNPEHGHGVSVGEEASVNHGEPCSPPSCDDARESDDDGNNQGSLLIDKSLPVKGSCKRKSEVGVKAKSNVVLPSSQLDPSISTSVFREKLNVSPKCGAKSQSEEHHVGGQKRQKLNTEPVDNKVKESGTNTKLCNLHHDFFTKDASLSNSESKVDRHYNVNSVTATDRSDADPTIKCMFCHSSSDTEASGPMLHYVDGKPVAASSATWPMVMHVHQKCIEWAPQVYFDGDIAKNLEAEVSRAAKIKCNRCGKKGAALGCYAKSCRKSFHVPCAVMIPDCRWDCDKFLVLCPSHISHRLPCDRPKIKKNVKAGHSPDGQISCHKSMVERYGKQETGELWTDIHAATREWMLCGSALSTEEKDLVAKFAKLTGVAVSKEWNENVTHVIASTDQSGACIRTFKFLMAILNGKWILKIDWIKACMEATLPVAEEHYEISDGPKHGRIRIKEAPKLFSGLSFYFSSYFGPSHKGYIEHLILAGGGDVLKDEDVLASQDTSDVKGTLLSRSCLVIYSADSASSSETNESRMKRQEEEAFAIKIGGQGGLDEDAKLLLPAHVILLERITLELVGISGFITLELVGIDSSHLHHLLNTSAWRCLLLSKTSYSYLIGWHVVLILPALETKEELYNLLERITLELMGIPGFIILELVGIDSRLEDYDSQITPNSILEDPLHYNGCSGSSSNNSSRVHSANSEECGVVKKKKGGGVLPRIVLSLSNWRKGAPQRSLLS